MHRLVVGILVLALAAATMTAVSFMSSTSAADAATGSQFDAGNIISDANFYAPSAMSQAQIQAFLVAKEATCRATTGPACLKSYTMATTSRVDSAGNCSTYPGGSSQSASTIIKNVAVACGISPRVLLVLLEKEQGLVTSTLPTAYMYRSATGYGCPDTAACDSAYYGFFNQVYMAALQFKRYAASPQYWAYQAGRTNNIFYAPNAACGTKAVYIQNKATASLYNYTPYTPNAAALANLYGTGDSCSAYGNRNFWRLYTDWFGSTTMGVSPVGSVDSVRAGLSRITLSGWAYDADATGATRVHVYVDGRGVASIAADQPRADLAASLGAGETDHGFSTTVSNVKAGAHSVCVYGINSGAGSNTVLKCQTVTVLAGNPVGALTSASAVAGTLNVAGWALDPDTVNAISVRVLVDGRSKKTVPASGYKGGVDAANPGYGNAHGFTASLTGLAAGSHAVCVTALNTRLGKDTSIGCKTVVVASGSPLLTIDKAVSTVPGSLTLSGWSIDFDTVDPVRVHIYVDGKGAKSLTASDAKAGLATSYPGYGPNHQFTVTLTGYTAATHQVCFFAMNVGAGKTSTTCRTVVAPSGSPTVALEKVASPSIGALTLSGFAVDPDTTAAARVHVYVDGVGRASADADAASATAASRFPGYGTHGYSFSLRGIGPGTHQVCVYAMNVGVGSTVKACSSVTMFGGEPVMTIDSVSSTATGTVSVAGWALDPDTASPVRVHVYIDGVGRASIAADGVRPDLTALYGGYGTAHGFTDTLSKVASGTHQVCLFAINQGAGGGNTWACKSVTVR